MEKRWSIEWFSNAAMGNLSRSVVAWQVRFFRSQISERVKRNCDLRKAEDRRISYSPPRVGYDSFNNQRRETCSIERAAPI